MAQYADACETNDIEWEFISELDHELLKNIGVSSVGHRMKLLEAGTSLEPRSLDRAMSRGEQTDERL